MKIDVQNVHLIHFNKPNKSSLQVFKHQKTMSEEVNSTITKMVKILRPSAKFDAHTPLHATKRSLSSNSTESSFEDGATPSKRSRLDSIMDVSYVGSPREVRRLRSDLLEARNNVMNLENRIKHMHGVRREMEVMYENETQNLKTQVENDRRTIAELEEQLQSIRKREIDLKEMLANVNSQFDLHRLESDRTVEKLEKDLAMVQEESAFSKGEDGFESSRLQRRIEELESVLQAAQEDAEAHKKLAFELTKRLRDNTELEGALELKEQALQKAKLQIKELEFAKESIQEFREQSKTQSQKLGHYSEMQRENQVLREENIRLKDEIKNKLILEEEVFDLKTRLVKAKEQDQKYANLLAKQTQMEMNLSEWRAVARGICESSESDSSLPHSVRLLVERLQQQEINLTSEKVELESKLKTSLFETKLAKSELEKCNKLLTELKQMGDSKQSLIHRIQKKLLLISRERDSYRLQLDSYEKDLTMCPTAVPGSNASASQKERIEGLERIVEGYREMLEKMESDLASVQPSLHSDMVPVKVDQIKRLQDEIDRLKHDNSQLRDRKDQLEVQLELYITGNDTLQGGQVYHLTNNPLADCLAQRERLVERLEQEIDRLKRKVKSYEEGKETSKLGDMSICPQEVQALREQIKSQETQTQRLKEYFKTSTQEFRNVMYMLLGYRVDRTAKSLYRLRHVYADRAEDQLCFQVNSAGDLELLETDFSRSVGDMIDLHLTQNKSIPLFLSAITIDLFNNRTKTYQID